MISYLSLYDILPDVQVDYDRYWQSEKEITPQLEQAGFEIRGSWYTGDGDSFGPLTRCIDTNKGIIVYG